MYPFKQWFSSSIYDRHSSEFWSAHFLIYSNYLVIAQRIWNLSKNHCKNKVMVLIKFEIPYLCLSLRVSLKNRKVTKMKGKEAKLYAIRVGSFESKTNPKFKYMASITQIMPIITYLVLKTNLSACNCKIICQYVNVSVSNYNLIFDVRNSFLTTFPGLSFDIV